jgi:UDP-N-acetylmuramate-alanine ligase
MGGVCGAANARRKKQRSEAFVFIEPLVREACESDRKFEEAWSKLKAKLLTLED